jgi:hypothetical protein
MEEVRPLDITSGIARASMEMASARVTTEAQVAVLKNAMDVHKETMAILLESMGMGRKLNVKA